MLRLAGFFFLVMVLLGVARNLLGWVPILGPLLGVPIIGFWIVAAVVAAAASRFASSSIDRSRQRALVRQLGAVDTPHNQGKLGSLLLSQGRAKRAREPLARAVAGEPEVAEWAYRLGCALQDSGDHEGALIQLDRALTLDERIGYGTPLLLGVQSLQSLGELEPALERVERFEREHGPNPESSYRRGRVLSALGRRPEAREAYAQVSQLAQQSAAYQRSSALPWILRASWARLFA